jgi:signal transduction histidine kinase
MSDPTSATSLTKTMKSPYPTEAVDISTDLEHINQEMYKKNFELAVKNQILSMLQKIDEIILGAVTDTKQIANEVTKLLVEESGFKIASIFIKDPSDKDVLSQLSLLESITLRAKLKANKIQLQPIGKIPLLLEEKIIVQAVRQRRIRVTNNFFETLLYNLDPKMIPMLTPIIDVKTTVLFPLFVRGEVIGVMVVCLEEDEKDLSEFHGYLLDRLVGVIGIAIDNALLYNEVQETNEKLKAIDKLKDEFVSLASHELKTPMTAIKSYLWMALAGKGGPLTEKQLFYLERSYKSTDRLIKLVNDMLNISRIESGRLTIVMQEVYLDKLIQEILDEIYPRTQEVQVNVTLAPVNFSPVVMADPDKIKEVYLNIIGNALKFTPKGGSVTISLTQNNRMIQTTITDTGIGIKKEDIGKLFQKFNLLPGSYRTNQTAQGTGLGLYICKKIIELHGGTISAASNGENQGSTFSFTLKPYNAQEAQSFNTLHPVTPDQNVNLIHTEI